MVVENFSPGVMARKGLGYEDLRAIKPDVILASISGFGQTGPLSHRPCFDLIAQAYAGIMHMTGEPDGPPDVRGNGNRRHQRGAPTPSARSVMHCSIASARVAARTWTSQ